MVAPAGAVPTWAQPERPSGLRSMSVESTPGEPAHASVIRPGPAAVAVRPVGAAGTPDEAALTSEVVEAGGGAGVGCRR